MTVNVENRGMESDALVVPPYGDACFATLGDSNYVWECVFPSRGAAKEFRVEEGRLLIDSAAVRESYHKFGQLGDKQLVLLDPHYPGIGEAVEMLSREQFSPKMYHADYINGKKTVNFPLTAEKLANFSRIDGMQLLGVLDAQGKLCGFACFFVKEWPDFAGDLKTVADGFAKNSDPKAYLYLVLVRPEAKGDGAFEELYRRVRQASLASGNQGCAIEIHQLNTQSVLAHKRIGFADMGTTVTHEREDVTGVKFPLTYRRYYYATDRASSSGGPAQGLLEFGDGEGPLF